MSTSLKNLSDYDPAKIPSAKKMQFGIVVSEWNPEITNGLLDGALTTLVKHGAREEDIFIKHVPGSFELPLAAKFFADHSDVDAVICLGCVIQGETRHFEFICNAVANGITKVNLDCDIPVIFGVLTTNTHEQAADRSGGKHGNKGVEAAVAAIKMIALHDEIRKK